MDKDWQDFSTRGHGQQYILVFLFEGWEKNSGLLNSGLGDKSPSETIGMKNRNNQKMVQVRFSERAEEELINFILLLLLFKLLQT